MNKNDFWNADWVSVQQKYWQNLSDFSRHALGIEAPQKSPWEQALDHWWQTVSPALPDPGREFVTRMMEQGKQLFTMSEDFVQHLQNGGGEDWREALEKTFVELQSLFTETPEGFGGDAAKRAMSFWEMPADNWSRMVSSLSLTPGDALRNMPHEAASGHLDRLLEAPGLGYSREMQGQQQRLAQLVVEYQRSVQTYLQFFSNLGVLSVDRMRGRVEKMLADGETIDSARRFYDGWVECCEEVYGEQVATEEYAKIHGHLVNSLMGLKQQMSVQVDEVLGALDMPTRRELRTLQTRMQENRREIKRSRAAVEQLGEEVEALKGELQALGRSQAENRALGDELAALRESQAENRGLSDQLTALRTEFEVLKRAVDAKPAAVAAAPKRKAAPKAAPKRKAAPKAAPKRKAAVKKKSTVKKQAATKKR